MADRVTSLRPLALVCSLKPSPPESSSELIAGQVRHQLRRYDVEGETVRCVDDNVMPGVEADMGDSDQWPQIRRKVLDADILVLATPTWLGHVSSVAQRVLEPVDAQLSNTDEQGRPAMVDKVALAAERPRDRQQRLRGSGRDATGSRHDDGERRAQRGIPGEVAAYSAVPAVPLQRMRSRHA